MLFPPGPPFPEPFLPHPPMQPCTHVLCPVPQRQNRTQQQTLIMYSSPLGSSLGAQELWSHNLLSQWQRCWMGWACIPQCSRDKWRQRRNACSQEHLLQNTGQMHWKWISKVHRRIRVLQCAHAQSETVHNTHHYSLLSPWHRHTEVLNGQSSYSAILSAVLLGKNTQAHNTLTSINRLLSSPRRASSSSAVLVLPWSRSFNQIGMSPDDYVFEKCLG